MVGTCLQESAAANHLGDVVVLSLTRKEDSPRIWVRE